jgi:ATP-dependent DNA helicase HFM1/MER3
VAYHHGHTDPQDRSMVEQRYLRGDINVICCTSTLAVGVNLPCHLVIIKGTQKWTENGPDELSSLEALQMLGRAGRPQFDTTAIAVIMTRTGHVKRWQRMLSGDEVVESRFDMIGSELDFLITLTHCEQSPYEFDRAYCKYTSLLFQRILI